MKHKDKRQTYLAVHEVYYNEDKQPYLSTKEPILIVDQEEGVEGLIRTATMILRDLKRSQKDILDYPLKRKPKL